MGTKSSTLEDPDLPNNNVRKLLLVATDKSIRPASTETSAVADAQQNLINHTPVAQRGRLAHLQFPEDTSGSFASGHEQPEFFFDSLILPALSPVDAHLKEENVNQEKEADDFHDSDAEDVYDLYLAVNGSQHNGLLDVRKLKELTPEESEILNVPRLREIWSHTATGCPKCKEIIRTLNIVRDVLREEATDSFAETEVELMDQAERAH